MHSSVSIPFSFSRINGSTSCCCLSCFSCSTCSRWHSYHRTRRWLVFVMYFFKICSASRSLSFVSLCVCTVENKSIYVHTKLMFTGNALVAAIKSHYGRSLISFHIKLEQDHDRSSSCSKCRSHRRYQSVPDRPSRQQGHRQFSRLDWKELNDQLWFIHCDQSDLLGRTVRMTISVVVFAVGVVVVVVVVAVVVVNVPMLLVVVAALSVVVISLTSSRLQ